MESLSEWWSAIDWAGVGVWTLTVTLLITGVLGAVLPLLPGPAIIFAAGVLHTWLRPQSGMSTWGIVLLGLLLIAAYATDMASSAMGAKWFGASKWGIVGVIVGGVVGMFFGLLGLLLGPIIGGLVFEVALAKREWKDGLKSTWGSLVGTGVGLILRLALSFAMVALFFIDALWL
jgi:uncharacterized protein YqgC (DUF456 family)